MGDKSVRLLVSACLLGMNCRYCGGGCEDGRVVALLEECWLVPVCPEQLGGLPTPRAPNEILNGRVVESDGRDNTEAFERGAQEALRAAKLLGCDFALFKERSPSCGSNMIYDGSFTGRQVHGAGVTARLLAAHGIRVFSEEHIEDLRGALNWYRRVFW